MPPTHAPTLTPGHGARSPGLRMVTPARAMNIGLVRQALGGMADVLAWHPEAFEDVKVAVSEACANVVAHAYADADADGTLEVEAWPDGRLRLLVVVRDRGPGPAARRDRPGGMGLGLPIMRTLAEAIEFARDGDATEVRMTFRMDRPGRRV